MDTKKTINWLKLCNVRGLGSRKLMKITQYFDSFENFLRSDDNKLLRSRIFTEEMLKRWKQLQLAQEFIFEKNIRLCADKGIFIVPLFSEGYPRELKHLTDAPKTLFMNGNISLLKEKKVAIVGSRESTQEAIDWAYNLSRELAEKGIVIVSGGAKGIDIAAHKGALDAKGKTICIFGTGLLNHYPEEHSEIYHKIIEKGLLISEHLPNFTGGRIALLQRNRIISAISNVLIQVTSSLKGGSRTQLNVALQQRVPVFCPKKELGFMPQEGINQIRETYKINEITTAEDILNFLKQEEGNEKEKEGHQIKLFVF